MISKNKLIIITVIIINTLNYINNVECGTVQEIQPAQNIQEIIHNLNIEDLMLVGEHLGINHQHFFEQILNDGNEISNTNNHNLVPWNSIIIFILGTLTLFVIARYGRDIVDLLFDLSTNTVPEIAQQSIRGLLQYAINTGHENVTRAYLAQQAQNLLNDPETAPRVVNAFRVINRQI